MGFNTGKSRGGLMSEINVTPMVDVMLVLLIIFMVTAPMMTQGLEVDLPETTAKSLRQEEEPVIISLDKDGKIMLGKIEVSQAMFRQQLEKQHGKNTEQPIFLKADKNVAYGIVASLMADIKDAGFDKLGMITLAKEDRH
ncbi:MAG: protein TolR [Thermodesulfobacteriota bacterium]|nr:protein TolR [Thermodesulfobacteriota bacterium]